MTPRMKAVDVADRLSAVAAEVGTPVLLRLRAVSQTNDPIVNLVLAGIMARASGKVNDVLRRGGLTARLEKSANKSTVIFLMRV